jgi:hypothetical protein
MDFLSKFNWSFFAGILCLLVGGVALVRRKCSKNDQLIYIYVLLCELVDLVATLISPRPNTWLYNACSVIEFSFLMYIYSRVIYSVAFQKSWKYILSVYVALCIGNIAFVQGVNVFNSVTFLIGLLIVITIAYWHIIETVRTDESISDKPFLWFSIANFIYYTSSSAALGTAAWFTEKGDKIGRSVLNINTLLYSLWYLIITLAFLWLLRKKTYTP